jgi:substrate-binding protein of zinc uptake complex component A
VVENGDGLDRWIKDVVEQAGGHPTVIDLGTRVPVTIPSESTGPEASRFDPHWWHDPRNAQAAVAAIRDALTRSNPDAKDVYARNATHTLAKLRALDHGIAACFRRIPTNQRKLVTTTTPSTTSPPLRHPGLGAVIPSQTTQAPPAARDIARLTQTICHQHVKAIFPESSINPKLAQAIANQTGGNQQHHALRRHPRTQGQPRRHLPHDGASQRRRDGPRRHRRAAVMCRPRELKPTPGTPQRERPALYRASRPRTTRKPPGQFRLRAVGGTSYGRPPPRDRSPWLPHPRQNQQRAPSEPRCRCRR